MSEKRIQVATWYWLEGRPGGGVTLRDGKGGMSVHLEAKAVGPVADALKAFAAPSCSGCGRAVAVGQEAARCCGEAQ